MAISQFAESPRRRVIGYVGHIPKDASDAFTSRGFEVMPLNESLLSQEGFLQQIDSAFIFQSEGMTKPTEINSVLEAFARPLLAHDCRVYVQHLPLSDRAEINIYRQRVINAINSLKLPAHAYSLNEEERRQFTDGRTTIDRPTLGPFVYVVPDQCDWGNFTNIVKNNPAGAAPNSTTLVVFPAGSPTLLSSEETLLIQRAFHDCRKVELVPISNGRSGASTFRVYAELRDNVVKTEWPYVHFVKLGKREVIVKEYYNFQESALGHVPFHLGPRLKLERCGLGHDLGILVSDYVIGAEALRDCARDGRAATAVGSLFSTTIASWRSGARNELRNTSDAMFDPFPTEIPEHRKHHIQGYGTLPDLGDLKKRLYATRFERTLMGVIHGDLHATNVLVRGTEAIIIDFEKIKFDAPMLYDAASLEAGLLVDGFRGDVRNGRDVLNSIQDMYTAQAFTGDLLSCHPKDGSSWYFDCVRQIRLHAKAMEQEPFQYAWTLAFVLAKKACKNEEFLDPDLKPEQLTREELRALALVLTEQIVYLLPKTEQ